MALDVYQRLEAVAARLQELEAQLMEINAERANEKTKFMDDIRLAAFTACIPLGGGSFDRDSIHMACKKAVLWSETYNTLLSSHTTKLS